MYALSLGIQNIGQSLPLPVYALLSGLNASIVGIIALAAVQLADKAIRDKLTRIQVLFGACAGVCYNALWYFPILMVAGGLASVIWDGWMAQQVRRLKLTWQRRHSRPAEPEEAAIPPDVDGETPSVPVELQEVSGNSQASNAEDPQQTASVRSRKVTPANETRTPRTLAPTSASSARTGGEGQPSASHSIRIRIGVLMLVLFFGRIFIPLSCIVEVCILMNGIASFIAILVARGVLYPPPLVLDLFASMYLAGTIIFGGGPVVIPLLRSYVVTPGWVSGRDFLIGLALIQSFPGPNFNFAVYLGALSLQHSRLPTVLGAFLAGLGIFLPGIVLAVAVQSFWQVLRRRKWAIDFLRGVNATAVGLVFTAVYRLWEIGYLTPQATSGESLGKNPWWVVVTTVAYAQGAWFGVPPFVAVIFGAALGLIWYGAVGR